MPRIRRLNGYEYFYDPKHPQANASGIVYVHRVVASRMLGRNIKRDEHVHHKNGDRADNNVDNLLITTRSEHSKIHNETMLIESTCPFCGDQFVQHLRKRLRKYCSVLCARLKARKVERPTRSQMLNDILTMGWCAIGRKYGVSDNAARKWARRYGIIETP